MRKLLIILFLLCAMTSPNSLQAQETQYPLICMVVDGVERCSRVCPSCAAHYGKTVMLTVAGNRGITPSDCMFASPYRALGSWAYIESGVNGKVELCQVLDVPRPEHWEWITKRGIVAELDYYSAVRLCEISSVGSRPPWECPVAIYDVEQYAVMQLVKVAIKDHP